MSEVYNKISISRIQFFFCQTMSRFNKTTLGGPYDAIIIGSGMGGMSAAASLCQCSDLRVLVLERHPTTIGGCTHEFTRKDVEFGTGLHYVGAMESNDNAMRRVFDFVTGNKVKWLKMDDAFDSTVVNGRVIEIKSGYESQEFHLRGEFPKFAREIHEYFVNVKKEVGVYKRFVLAQLASGYVPNAVTRLLVNDSFGQETVAQALDRLNVVDPELRLVLAYNYGDYGYSPEWSSWVQHCVTVDHYANGSSYPVGGPHVIGDAVTRIVEERGGKMLFGAHVDSLIVKNNTCVGVKVQGMEILAPIVISAAGAYNTFTQMIALETAQANPKLMQAREQFTSGVLEASPQHCMVFAVFKGTSKELGLPVANVWVQDCPDFPFVFLSFPSSRDASWCDRNPDKSVCEIVVEGRYEDFAKLNDDEYQVKKKEFAEKALAVLFHKYPRLENRLQSYTSSTPRTAKRFLGSQNGCSYGVSPTPARFRAHREWLKPVTPVKNLYLAGQDVLSCGICGAMMGGLFAAAVADIKVLVKTRELMMPMNFSFM